MFICLLLLAISRAVRCGGGVCTSETECVSTLPQCCSEWALCVRRAIFYVFALHALSDTNKQLMCVGAVAETFHRLMIIVSSLVSTHPS